jgi:hypothetical protein
VPLHGVALNSGTAHLSDDPKSFSDLQTSGREHLDASLVALAERRQSAEFYVGAIGDILSVNIGHNRTAFSAD